MKMEYLRSWINTNGRTVNIEGGQGTLREDREH
jgi:hypothetical protein